MTTKRTSPQIEADIKHVAALLGALADAADDEDPFMAEINKEAELAKFLNIGSGNIFYDLAVWLGKIPDELKRRPAVKHAAPRPRPATSTPEAIRQFTAANPGLNNHDIAVHFGVNTARVSEALAGFRNGKKIA